jgi:hypothetical protein
MTRKSETDTPVVASPLNDKIALSLARMMMRFSSREAMMR